MPEINSEKLCESFTFIIINVSQIEKLTCLKSIQKTNLSQTEKKFSSTDNYPNNRMQNHQKIEIVLNLQKKIYSTTFIRRRIT